MKNIIIITGGAGFIGSHLIEILLKKTKKKIISLDNYSTGSAKNHLKNSRVKYLTGNTININKILFSYRKRVHSLFHFGEFSRIFQSFKKFDECFDSNSIGSKAVFKFCLDNKVKLIYSATSASLGNKGKDANLSPYAFLKSKNLELLENLKKWFNFKYEIIYFYNVYGPRQIKSGEMATVIGIFEDQFKKKMPLTVVKPGITTRRFTHVYDTVKFVMRLGKKINVPITVCLTKKVYSINEVAKMFNSSIIMVKPRSGERYASALTNMSLNNKVIRRYGKINLKDYITSFIKDKKL